VHSGQTVSDAYANSVADALLEALKSSGTFRKPAKIARRMTDLGAKSPTGGAIYGKLVTRLMAKLPAVVEEANAFRDARETAYWKQTFGKEPPASMSEVSAGLAKHGLLKS
jgi:hypothetical protein